MVTVGSRFAFRHLRQALRRRSYPLVCKPLWKKNKQWCPSSTDIRLSVRGLYFAIPRLLLASFSTYRAVTPPSILSSPTNQTQSTQCEAIFIRLATEHDTRRIFHAVLYRKLASGNASPAYSFPVIGIISARRTFSRSYDSRAHGKAESAPQPRACCCLACTQSKTREIS
jgi:hypothetical protein